MCRSKTYKVNERQLSKLGRLDQLNICIFDLIGKVQDMTSYFLPSTFFFGNSSHERYFKAFKFIFNIFNLNILYLNY